VAEKAVEEGTGPRALAPLFGSHSGEDLVHVPAAAAPGGFV